MLGIIRRILTISGKYRGKLIFSFVMSFLENAMFALSIFFVFIAFRWVITDNLETSKILLLAIALVLSLIFRFLFKLLEYIFQSGVGYEIVCDERLKLGEKLLHLSMGFYSDTDAGDISSVINNDLVFVEGLAMNFVSKITGAIASAVLVAAFLFILDWRIALVACIGYPLAWLANRFIQRTFTNYSKERQETHAETSSIMLEYLQGIYVIKAFRLAGRQKERLEDLLKRLEIVSFDFEMKGLPWIGHVSDFISHWYSVHSSGCYILVVRFKHNFGNGADFCHHAVYFLCACRTGRTDVRLYAPHERLP